MNECAPWPARMTGLSAKLDAFLESHWLPATRAARVFSPDELPVRLESYIRFLGSDIAWRAYSDHGQIFCAIGRIVWLVSRTLPARSLEVCFLDSSAKIYSNGIWQLDPNLGWQLQSVPPLPHTPPVPGIFPAAPVPTRWTS